MTTPMVPVFLYKLREKSPPPFCCCCCCLLQKTLPSRKALCHPHSPKASHTANTLWQSECFLYIVVCFLLSLFFFFCSSFFISFFFFFYVIKSPCAIPGVTGFGIMKTKHNNNKKNPLPCGFALKRIWAIPPAYLCERFAHYCTDLELAST